MKLRMKKAACVLMSCLILWTGISDCYIESQAIAVADDVVFFVFFAALLGAAGISVKNVEEQRQMANAFQSDLERGRINTEGYGITESDLESVKSLILNMRQYTVGQWITRFSRRIAFTNEMIKVFKAWLGSRYVDQTFEIDDCVDNGINTDWADSLPKSFFLEDENDRPGKFQEWLGSHAISNYYVVLRNSNKVAVFFFTKPIDFFVANGEEVNSSLYANDDYVFTQDSIPNYNISKYYLSSFGSYYDKDNDLCGQFCNGFSWYVGPDDIVDSSGVTIYGSRDAYLQQAKKKITVHGTYYDISGLYGKSLALDEDMTDDTIPNAVDKVIAENPDIPDEELEKLIKQAVDEALEGKVIIDDTKDESGDSSEEDKNKLPVADLVGFLMDYLPSIKKDVNNVYNVLNNIDVPDYTDYFTRIIEYLNSIYNDVLDRLDTIIRTLDVIPGILRTLDTSSDDKADIPSFPDTMKITFSELINWDSIASHFQHDYENLVEQIKNLTFNIDFPDLSILGTISGNILEIKNFFDIDYNEVEGEVEELQEEVKKKFPLLEIVAFFALLDAFTFDMEYPEITMDVPEFLSSYFDSKTILLVDLGDYSEQLGFVRNIIRAAMYIYFAYYIATKHFDFHLSID